MDRISGPFHPRKQLIFLVELIWLVCNRNGDKLNVNCRKAKMLTVHGHRVCGRLCRALQLSQFRTSLQSSYNLYNWSFVMEFVRVFRSLDTGNTLKFFLS